MEIWWLVAVSIAVVLICILIFRLHAFVTLLLAGLLVASLTSQAALVDFAGDQVASGGWTDKAAKAFADRSAPSRLAIAFGETAGSVGILIALASIVGQCLLESRAALTIVDSLLRVTGKKRAAEALAASSFVLGIPVFFDTVFYLMVPLARSLRQRTGGDYVLFILAILAGGSIAHSLIPPTPGPLQVAEIIGVDIGTMLLVGLGVGGCSSVLSLWSARVINRYVSVPLRSLDSTAEATDEPMSVPEADPSFADSSLASPSTLLPPLMLALLPIMTPVILIATAAILDSMLDAGKLQSSPLTQLLQSVGDKNVALGIAVLISSGLLRYIEPAKRKSLINRSLSSAGNIILITAAGGAFGAMLRQAGIADAVSDLASDVPLMMLLPIAFGVTAAIRTLQGSSTVAMITAAGVLQGFADADGLPFHPVYLAMAIGAGSKPIAWMTDSGFWVMCKMSGMTEREGLLTVSPMSTAMGINALVITMLFAKFLPLI